MTARDQETTMTKTLLGIACAAAVSGGGLSMWNSSEDNTSRGEVVVTMKRLDTTVGKMDERLRAVELKVAVIQSHLVPTAPTSSGAR